MDNNHEVLNKLHSVLFELLCEFDRICKKHNIQYFLDSGTALGAVRHGGFIPWDDDLDVGMMRDQYEKFLKVAPEEIGDNYIILSKNIDTTYKKYHVKLMRKNTIYPEIGNENCQYRGIFIDIFPFDKVSDNINIRKSDFAKDLLYKRLIRLKVSKLYCMNFSKLLLHYFLKLVPMNWLEKKMHNLWMRHNESDSLYATCYLYKMLLKQEIVFPISSLLPIKDIRFENKEFFIMNNYDDYLKIMYGDYMKLPPENKREFHCCGNVIFDEDKKNHD